MLKNIKLILFDLDGVIIDSKLNMKKSWRKVRIETKTKVKFEEYFKCIGMPFKKTLAKLKIKKNLLLIENIYKKESLKNIKNGAGYYDNFDIDGVVNYLQNYKPTRLCSNAKITSIVNGNLNENEDCKTFICEHIDQIEKKQSVKMILE